jgi:hypothetical protein
MIGRTGSQAEPPGIRWRQDGTVLYDQLQGS